MSNLKAGSLFGLALTLLAVIFVGYIGIAYIGHYPPFQAPAPGQVTTVPGVTTITGGGGQKYAGSVSFLISPIWAYSGAASNEGTNDPTYNFYHANKVLIGAETITRHVPVATTLTVSPEDQAIVYLDSARENVRPSRYHNAVLFDEQSAEKGLKAAHWHSVGYFPCR